VVDIAVDQQTGTLALGDVRDVADGKRLKAKSQQKIGNWSHGQLRQQIEYKAAAAGITVELVDEAYSSQTCPDAGTDTNPRDGSIAVRLAVSLLIATRSGRSTFFSRRLHGEVGRIRPPAETKYRHPFGKLAFRTGKRSRPDTANWLRQVTMATKSLEAAGLLAPAECHEYVVGMEIAMADGIPIRQVGQDRQDALPSHLLTGLWAHAIPCSICSRWPGALGGRLQACILAW